MKRFGPRHPLALPMLAGLAIVLWLSVVGITLAPASSDGSDERGPIGTTPLTVPPNGDRSAEPVDLELNRPVIEPPIVQPDVPAPALIITHDAPRLGFALNVHDIDDHRDWFGVVDEIASFGADSMLIVTPMYQRHGTSSNIRRDPSVCPSDEQLRAILQYAHETHALRTTLMPIVLLSEPKSNEWRGKIMPDDWNGWWFSYRERMMEFARIASQTQVSTLVVGSELNSTEASTDRWCSLIADVRGRYRGELTYSANWDRYRRVSFWEELDVISISAWWKIALTPDAEMPDLVSRWSSIRDDLLAFAGERERPIRFSEMGYPTVSWALEDPWNYVIEDGDDTRVDPIPQANGYEAFFRAWESVWDDERFGGLHCYEWDPYREGGPDDYHYGIRGKPAFDVVRGWFARVRE